MADERQAATARDLLPGAQGARDPLDWYIEVCAVCGCQLGPGIGARTRTGRCIFEEHRQSGGVLVRVSAKPLSEQEPIGSTRRVLTRLGVPE